MRRFAFTAMCLLALSLPSTADNRIYNPENGHYYLVVANSSGISWTDAQSAAVAAGGYLATVTSSSENEFIFNLAQQNDTVWGSYAGWMLGPWLGGYQQTGSTEPDGGWRWVTDEPFTYTNWAPIAFDMGIAHLQDRVQMSGMNNIKGSTWDDNGCDTPQHGYVIEWNAVPEPSSLLALACGFGALGCIRRRRKS
ncbi:MAG: lectin-like protein [Armatimonadota bacterium]|nr:PEP-CTERM sorting domain-containing protein [bacterium]